MKLSEVLAYKELLDEKRLQTDFHDTTQHLNSIVVSIEQYQTQIGTFTQDIQEAANQVRESFARVDNVLANLQAVLEQLRSNAEPGALEASTRLWREDMRHETPEYVLNRRLAIDPEDYEVLYGHMLGCTDWRLPGLIFRPGKEKHIENMVPMDPLYLVDTSQELLDPCIEQFTIEYQRRLRPYVISDLVHGEYLHSLPQGQFGLVYGYNYFNYKPLEVIYKYLKEVYSLLRPGGSFIFTFNDCDYAHGTALAERNFMCYTPGSLIENRAILEGFEVTYRHRGLGDVAWFELKKPGTIDSLRGGQSLAKIFAKSK